MARHAAPGQNALLGAAEQLHLGRKRQVEKTMDMYRAAAVRYYPLEGRSCKNEWGSVPGSAEPKRRTSTTLVLSNAYKQCMASACSA